MNKLESNNLSMESKIESLESRFKNLDSKIELKKTKIKSFYDADIQNLNTETFINSFSNGLNQKRDD